LEKGYLLYGRYRIEAILGRGGMGAVYKALDENLGISVAVKENLFTTEEYARQFKREATILASLRHNNLPRVTDHFVIPGQGQYLVMDYIDGEDVRTRIEKGNIPSERLALDWARQICDALHYLHRRQPPVVHRDIKPGNIRITPDGRAMLVDFGLARLMEGASTTTGAKAMTPGYSPPEQYGASRTDTRTDIYALAATLYTLFAGAMPEDGLERALGQKALTPLRTRNPKVSPGVAAAIEKALEVLPENRFQTIGEFFAELDSSEQPIAEGTPAQDMATRRAPEKNPLAPARKPTPPPAKPPATPPASGGKRKSPIGCLLWIILLVALALAGVVIAATKWDTIRAAFLPFATMIPAVRTTGKTPTQPISIPTETLASPTETPVAPTETYTPTITPVPIATITAGSQFFAYVSDHTDTNNPQIFIRDLAGTSGAQITFKPEGACQPEWSPDGMQLLFVSPCKNPDGPLEKTTIFRINIDGTGETSLTKIPGGDYDPAWSPDGKSILFTSLQGGTPRIYVMDLNGDNRVLLSPTGAREAQARWSPDGKQIVFVSYSGSHPFVEIMDSAGSNRIEFSSYPNYSTLNPDWSVNNRILYILGSKGQVVSAQANDRFNAPSISPAYKGTMTARFSPDGQWILFDCQRDCTIFKTGDKVDPPNTGRDIYLMPINGASVGERITSDPGNETDPVWRPAKLTP
jgi:Tol biopolymer transport system component